jgi:ABC-2 type transport system permease protein
MTGAGSPHPFRRPQEDSTMTTSLTTTLTKPAAPAISHPTAGRTGPSFPALVALEARKSLSTRSGRAVAIGSVLLAPAAMGVASASGDAFGSADGPIGAAGVLTALVLLALGVLATAGEWTHGTVQTTFLLVPQRGRVLAAKALAMAGLGLVLAALASGLATLVLAATLGGDLSWDAAPRALVSVVVAGAAFAVIGAGAGAAVANSPAAMTGIYLLVLAVFPLLRTLQPGIADALDPTNATLDLTLGTDRTSSIAVLVGWVVVSTAAGVVLTRRRAVQ